jgi:1-acyl-sn-glycerol-3-phosphate acyltransferase
MQFAEKVLGIISSYVLYFMGWEELKEKEIYDMSVKKKMVCVFSHTSYSDFYIMLLYMLANKQKLSHLRFIVKPQPFEYAKTLLEYFQCIPASKIQEKNKGGVQRIVDACKKEEAISVLICPKGTIEKAEWRSGYYHIAKELDASLTTLGLDYYKKKVVTFSSVHHTEGIEYVEKFLKKRIAKIIPRFMDQEVVDIKYKVPQSSIHIINPKRIFFLCFCIMAFTSYSYYKLV